LVSFAAIVVMALLLRMARTPRQATAPPPPLLGSPPDPSWSGRPRPGEIWLARRDDAQLRCVVLRTYPTTVDVLSMADDGAVHLLPDAAFVERTGPIDPETWAQVQRAHRTGYAA
jgi:hypothetical protein